MTILGGVVLLGLVGLLFPKRRATPSAGPLKLVPLPPSELARQMGLSDQHFYQSGVFPPAVQEAVFLSLLDAADRKAHLANGASGTSDASGTRGASGASNGARAGLPDPDGGPQIYFKDGEPTDFEDYGGQAHVWRYLQACIDGMDDTSVALDQPQAFTGSAGGGKTLLAKVTAKELERRADRLGLARPDFIEVFTNDVPNAQALDRYMRRVQQTPGCVLFIDELHSIVGKEHWLKFYLVLEEGRYLFEGDAHPTRLPPFTILGATTNWGDLDEAQRRRFFEHEFHRASRAELRRYVEGRGEKDYPITASAVEEILDRVHHGGAPWEALQVYRVAKVFARARYNRGAGPSIITEEDVKEVWTVNQIDEFGLRPVDRKVIAAIFTQARHRRNRETGEQEFVCYAASEGNTYQMARVDRREYQDYIRPKLMSRGLLEIRVSYGQALTQRCIDRYGHLRETA
jgi:Holliday junction resolvasome RuvABC ATP-dependent DNA helicase subunit